MSGPCPEKNPRCHARVPSDITTESPQRIGDTFAIEAGGRGLGMFSRTASGCRKARVAPLMQSLYDWILQQMKHCRVISDTAKVCTHLLKLSYSLNMYSSNDWAVITTTSQKRLTGKSEELVVHGLRQRQRTILSDRHMPSEQCGTRKMAACVIGVSRNGQQTWARSGTLEVQ